MFRAGRLGEGCYRFPANRRAETLQLWQQIEKCQEEVDELRYAYDFGEGDDRVLEEAVDLIVAAEGVLRKFPTRAVLQAFARVRIKNARRGDW